MAMLKRKQTDFIKVIGKDECNVRVRNCTLMENRSGWRGIEETLPDHLLVMVESGTLDLQLDDREFLLHSSETCWIPLGVRRNFRVPTGCGTSRNWRLRFSVLEDGQCLGVNGKCRIQADGYTLIPYFNLLRESLAEPALSREIKPLLQGMLLRYSALGKREGGGGRKLNAIQRRRVDGLIQRELLAGVRPADMAVAAGLSPDYFSRIFRDTYGVSPRRYLLEQRMRLAGDILVDSVLTIDELCAELGECDAGTFCKQFKKINGCTPGEYRKKFG